jgi:putative ABC transport system substrate-binding protein
MIKRRTFIAGLGAAAAWPLAARAQQTGRVRRIGIIFGRLQSDPAWTPWMTAFAKGLQELGWVEGRNVEFDRHWTLSCDQACAAELLSPRPDLIVAASGPNVVAVLQQMRGDIPIVFTSVSDPVGLGLVGSLAHPGGNVTGFTLFDGSVAGKLLEALKEFAPTLARAALIVGADNLAASGHFRALEAAATPLGVKALATPVRSAADIEQVIESFVREPNGALVVPPDTVARAHRELIFALAARHRLPAAFSDRTYVEGGGLMSYGPDLVDNYRRAAGYVDRILRGERAGDLPVPLPTKFDFAINLKTAKALGSSVPEALLLRADEVIE